MYLIWRNSMYYLSDYEHCICIGNTQKEVIEKCNKEGYINFDEKNIDEYPLSDLSDNYFEFDRKFHSNYEYFITEIPYDCDELYILQFVDYNGHVKIYFDDNPFLIQKELQVWKNNSVKFKYDNCFYTHYAEMKDGSQYDIYEFSLSIHD